MDTKNLKDLVKKVKKTNAFNICVIIFLNNLNIQKNKINKKKKKLIVNKKLYQIKLKLL